MPEELSTAAVRTLVVDDAPLMRKAIQQILSKQDDIEVVGTATNGRECLEKIRQLKPDVVTLDIDMPVMNGITAVKNIMVQHQIPIVIISSLVQDGYFAFEALRLGVMDFVPKPARVTSGNWADEEDLVRTRVRVASGMQAQRMRRVRRLKKLKASYFPNEAASPAAVVMGTTLAGPNTIMHIVTQLSNDFPGVVVALQEIHPKILVPFCSYFNEISPLEVVPVTGTCPLIPGKVYIGSTCTGIRVESSTNESGGFQLTPGVSSGSPIDQLFESAAQHFRRNVCGVLLTGVGTDGARGMRKIKGQGGLTIAQQQDCCVYPNLVEHAIREEVVDIIMSNSGIAGRLESWVQNGT